MDDDILQKSDKSRSPKGRIRARCPACSTWISLRDAVEVWDLVDCPDCKTLLEVVDLRPPTLDYANKEYDEWDDEEWEDEEEY